MKVIEKYLTNYAESVSSKVVDVPLVFDHVVVIPAFNEKPCFLEQKTLALGGSNLVIVVVNAPDSDCDPEKLKCTQNLLGYIQGEMDLLWQNGSKLMLLKNSKFDYHLLAVDCVSAGERLPVKQGVGLARKVGADLALSLIFNGKINSNVIYSTDADAEIPRGYFFSAREKVGEKNGGYAGYVFPFHHVAEKDFEKAMELYEFSLNYYVAGLRHAGSKYAFHTIGSCLAFDAESYAKVRGFPKRAAGEDFYLLNKLAKVGKIQNLASPLIKLAGRDSDRVPFGTGPAITKIADMKSPLDSYLFYNPLVFECLREFLRSLPGCWQQEGQGDLSIDYNQQIYAALNAIGFYKVLNKLRGQAKNRQAFLRACYDWFDAFKTLKFIHYLRDNYFHSVAVSELCACSIVLEMDKRYPAFFNK